MTTRHRHIKVFSPQFMLYQVDHVSKLAYPWVCRECGKMGCDDEPTFKRDEYRILVREFDAKRDFTHDE